MNCHCVLAAVVDSSHGGDLCSPQAFLEAGLLGRPQYTLVGRGNYIPRSSQKKKFELEATLKLR